MGWSKKAVTWSKRAKPVKCSCGCGVIIMPKPAWYKYRNSPPEVRYIRGHEPKADQVPGSTRPRQKGRPTKLIVSNTTPEAVIVTCPRLGCGTRWQVMPATAEYIAENGCVAFCQIEDIINERIALGLPVYPDDDLDESEGAVEMSVPTYNFLKRKDIPGLQTDLPLSAQTLGTLAHQIKTGTFQGTTKTEAEVRDILDQCGLSEEYI